MRWITPWCPKTVWEGFGASEAWVIDGKHSKVLGTVPGAWPRTSSHIPKKKSSNLFHVLCKQAHWVYLSSFSERKLIAARNRWLSSRPERPFRLCMIFKRPEILSLVGGLKPSKNASQLDWSFRKGDEKLKLYKWKHHPAHLCQVQGNVELFQMTSDDFRILLSRD